MTRKSLIIFAFALAVCASCARPSSIVWTEGPEDPSSGKAVHRLEIVNAPAGTDWTVWFCQFKTPVKVAEGSPADIEQLIGTLYRVVPRAEAQDGRMAIDYQARPLLNRGRAPEGFYIQKKGGKPVPMDVSYVWQEERKVHTFDCETSEPAVTDMIPRVKSFVSAPGTTPGDVQPEVTIDPSQRPGWYRITLDGTVRIEAADSDGQWYAGVTLDNLRQNAGGEPLPNGTITDWPDLAYRGLMLDVSRNFTSKENVLRLIDILARYKVSYFHIHLGDDEGWRVEIPGLPELTGYGAYRGIPVECEDGSLAEPDALLPSYCGTRDRNDASSPGNGFYSREDFVKILRYASDRHMRVIPEFDIPGHSRAAIKSMEVRAQRTGDTSCLLSEKEDVSKYVSVQNFPDNAINVALPSTYEFISRVFDAFIAMYADAGVPLDAIHIGGDEVPEGAWTGSPACKALSDSLGLEGYEGLNDYFLNRVLDIAEERNVKIAGWQEIALNIRPETRARLRKSLFFANLWSVSRGQDELAYEFANEGLGVVLSNAPNYYFDLAYNASNTERGYNWAGFVDERRSFSLLPYNVYAAVRWDDKGRPRDISSFAAKTPLKPEGVPYILGVQGQLWGETLRNFDHVTYYLFPKALGLFERGWNARPDWESSTVADDPAFNADFAHFFGIITGHEYAWYDSLGIAYHRHE